MDTITINNLMVGKSLLNATFTSPSIVGVYARNHQLINNFFDLLVGINKTEGKISFNDILVYDNAEYFSKRVLFDFSSPIVSTLRTPYIKDQLANNWQLSFNEDVFSQIVKTLNIRSELTIDCRYCFTNVGKTLASYALVKALNKEILFINNPTIHLKSFETIDAVVSGLTDRKEGKLVFLGLDNLKVFAGKLDSLILIGDEQTVLLNPNQDKLMAISGDSDLKEIIFRSSVNITKDGYDKTITKTWDKQKREYQRISVFDLEVFR